MRANLENSPEGLQLLENAPSAAAQEFDPHVYLAILRRRWLSLLIPAVLGFAIVAAVAYLWPPTFEATAKILVESQQIPTDLAQPTVTANALERIQSIEQRLMTRDNLLGMIQKFGLFPGERNRKSPSEIVDLIRQATVIAPIDPGPQRSSAGQVIGFTISFDYVDPDLASRVANEFVALILQQNIQARTGRAAETAKFFQQQSEKLGQDLTRSEAEIADFKTKNEEALPESLAYRRTVLLQLQGELTDLNHKIALAKGDQAAAGNADAQALQVQRLTIRLNANKQALASTRDERDNIKALVDKGVVAKNRLLELERSIASLEADVQTTEADLQLAKLNGGIGGADLSGLEAQRADLVKRIDALNQSISKTPEVEAALNALTRDHDRLQGQYRDAMAKVAAAGTGEDLEQNRQAERFEVIEQATPPSRPVKPNRAKIMLAGGLASVGAGAGLALLKEFLDKSIRTAADLEKRLQLRPISTIPYLTTSAERRRKRWRRLALALVAIVLAVAGLICVHLFYLPLDVLIPKLLLKVGLK